MRSPRRRARIAGTVVVLLAVAGAGLRGPNAVAGGATAADDDQSGPLARARAAVASLSFVAVVEVIWNDRTTHTERLLVRAAAGSLEVQGLTTAMADSAGARLLRRQDGGWDLLWSGSQAVAGRPDAGGKYEVVASTQEMAGSVAGRPVSLYEVHQGTTLRERLFLDTATGILLRREQLDASGVPRRVVSFTSFTLDPAMVAPASPRAPANHVPRPVPVTAGAPAPPALPGGYERTAAYREGDAVHVLYSDGLYDLSVFEQRAGLDTRDVPPSGTRVDVGRDHGWAYAWAGGQVVLWHAGHTVYTLVSDAPLDHLVAAAAALPAGGGAPSLVSRLRRACASIVGPMAG